MIVLEALFYRRLRGELSLVDVLSITALTLLYLPIAFALLAGQFQIFIDCAWAASVLLWCTGKRGWSGFAVGLTCAIKPQMALFLVWGLFRKEWRFVNALASAIAVVQGIAALRFGWGNSVDYLRVLSFVGRRGEAYYPNQSMNGLLNRFLSNGDALNWSPKIYPPYLPMVYYVSTAFTGLILLIALLLPRWKGWSRSSADYLFFGGIVVMASPIAWEHHYGCFTMLILYLLAQVERLGTVRLAVLTMAIVAISNRIPGLDNTSSNGVWSLGSSYLFYSAIALLVLLAALASSKENRNSGQQVSESALEYPAT